MGEKWKLKQLHKNVRSKTLARCRELGYSSDMQNDASVHRDDLEGHKLKKKYTEQPESE